MQDNPLGTTAAGTGSAETDETDRLISSNKVEGTAVYNRQGERLGSIYNCASRYESRPASSSASSVIR